MPLFRCWDAEAVDPDEPSPSWDISVADAAEAASCFAKHLWVSGDQFDEIDVLVKRTGSPSIERYTVSCTMTNPVFEVRPWREGKITSHQLRFHRDGTGQFVRADCSCGYKPGPDEDSDTMLAIHFAFISSAQGTTP